MSNEPACEPQPTGSGEERRSHDRVALQLLGTFFCAGGVPAACEVRDLAPGGVRLAAALAPELGARIALSVPALGRFQGEIIWVRNGQFAVQFTGKSDPRALAETLASRRGLAKLGVAVGDEDVEPTLSVRYSDRQVGTVQLKRMSVNGASFSAEHCPQLGEEILIGDMPCTVIKVVDDRFAVHFAPPAPD